MPLEVSELDSADLRRYEALNRTSPHGSVWTCASWADYVSQDVVPYGAFRGSELVGAALLPVSGGQVLRHVPCAPWMGLFARSVAEGECLEIAGRMAATLESKYGEVTLTLPPEWKDIRAFIWRGWRQHVRYTYRGIGYKMKERYEKRLRLQPMTFAARKERGDGVDEWDVQTVRDGDWKHLIVKYRDTQVDILEDWKSRYYWKANRGGTWHAEVIDGMIGYDNQMFDMVGGNGPTISLFKRQFGGHLVPYYAVTTSEIKDLRAESYERAA